MSDKPHPAAIDVNGDWYLRDAKGALVPIAMIKASDLLMDETVRSLVERARSLSADLAAFKADAFEVVGDLQALLAQEHGAKVGGAKGNVQLLTFDGCQRVQVQVSDRLDFGPELQAAKQLVDECLTDWAANGPAELKALVTRAFSVDQQGQIRRTELFMLLRVEITDERWLNAMAAVRASIRVVGSSRYARFYHRPAGDAEWLGVALDIAGA